MKVSDLMTTTVTKVKEADPIARVRRILGRQQFHALPVVDEWGYLSGIVTSADFVKIQGEEARHQVKEVMQRRVYTVRETADVVLAARFMAKYHVRHLVIARGGKVHGILSSFDMLRALTERDVPPKEREELEDPRAELERHGLKFVDSLASSDSRH
ncbi:MAG: CBS domain-containing protein [Planctomycetes bacterium]|nr:CBS domain-containing protein [Planctomycetota bacterium]